MLTEKLNEQRGFTERQFEVREYLRPRDASHYIGLSESTLAKLRMRLNRKSGPRFHKVSGCVVYKRADLEAWIEQFLTAGEPTQ